ncbi:DUF6624 domain-containing protein [Caulobacter sp. BK020]|uniref:DUF6624 domain-containing protein n=1 Tax=Caulobacter sp. BK020 TaxID=2512117 RepID=UPI0014048FD3|nr:DUF6624 domain-containing protein [Caulobacter sp. BK020]
MILTILAGAPAVAASAQGDPTVERVRAVAARAAIIEDIVGMAAVDQAMRTTMLEATSKLPPDQRDGILKPAGALIEAQDRLHTQRLKAIIAAHGWPKISETSERTSSAAVTLVNHAGFDLAFQRQVLALLEPLAAQDEARPEDYARLYDRLATVDKRPQRYGTRGTTCKDGRYAVPSDLEAPEGLEARRAAMGLQPMAEYLAGLDKMYGACVPPKIAP